MVKKKVSIEWLKAAYDDILTIDKIINDEMLTNIVAFHSQQAIEKTFKAIIEEYEINVPKIHNLVNLYKKVKELVDIKIEINLLKLLDMLYIDSRYPGDFGLLPSGKPTLEDAKEFYEFAKRIFDEVCQMLDVKI